MEMPTIPLANNRGGAGAVMIPGTVGARTGPPIPFPLDHATVGTDIDFDRTAVFRAGKFSVWLLTPRAATLLGGKVYGRDHGW